MFESTELQKTKSEILKEFADQSMTDVAYCVRFGVNWLKIVTTNWLYLFKKLHSEILKKLNAIKNGDIDAEALNKYWEKI